MTMAWSIAAIMIPWLAGIAIAPLLSDSTFSRMFRIGAGWFLGQSLVIGGLFVSLRIFESGHARILLLILVMIAVGALYLHSRKDRNSQATLSDRTFGLFGKVLLPIIGVSLGVKLAILIAAHANIPIRNDDAISTWLFKAKVVAALDRIPLSANDPYYRGGSNPHYPIFVSLMAAWPPMVSGTWGEQLATIPWLLSYINLILLIGGGLQGWCGISGAWAAAYGVASLPLLVVHVYRPGYADLILACFLAAACICFLNWISTARAGDFVLALIFAVVAALAKREGPVLAAWCVLVFTVAGRRRFRSYSSRLRVLLGTGATAGALAVAGLVDFTEHSETLAGFAYHREVWDAMYRHLFVWNSFGFFFVVATAAWVIVAIRSRGPYRFVSVALPTGWMGYVIAIFLFTPQARFALNDQTPSRLVLQIVPAIVVILAVALSKSIGGPTPGTLHEVSHVPL